MSTAELTTEEDIPQRVGNKRLVDAAVNTIPLSSLHAHRLLRAPTNGSVKKKQQQQQQQQPAPTFALRHGGTSGSTALHITEKKRSIQASRPPLVNGCKGSRLSSSPSAGAAADFSSNDDADGMPKKRLQGVFPRSSSSTASARKRTSPHSRHPAAVVSDRHGRDVVHRTGVHPITTVSSSPRRTVSVTVVVLPPAPKHPGGARAAWGDVTRTLRLELDSRTAAGLTTAQVKRCVANTMCDLGEQFLVEHQRLIFGGQELFSAKRTAEGEAVQAVTTPGFILAEQFGVTADGSLRRDTTPNVTFFVLPQPSGAVHGESLTRASHPLAGLTTGMSHAGIPMRHAPDPIILSIKTVQGGTPPPNTEDGAVLQPPPATPLLRAPRSPDMGTLLMSLTTVRSRDSPSHHSHHRADAIARRLLEDDDHSPPSSPPTASSPKKGAQGRVCGIHAASTVSVAEPSYDVHRDPSEATSVTFRSPTRSATASVAPPPRPPLHPFGGGAASARTTPTSSPGRDQPTTTTKFGPTSPVTTSTGREDDPLTVSFIDAVERRLAMERHALWAAQRRGNVGVAEIQQLEESVERDTALLARLREPTGSTSRSASPRRALTGRDVATAADGDITALLHNYVDADDRGPLHEPSKQHSPSRARSRQSRTPPIELSPPTPATAWVCDREPFIEPTITATQWRRTRPGDGAPRELPPRRRPPSASIGGDGP